MYHGNNVGHPLYPQNVGQTLTYIMTSRSTSFEPKSQLIINLDPGWECQSLPSEENKKREKENSQSKSGRKQKKERKFPIKDRKKTEETSRKVFGPDNIWTIQNCHQVNKIKGNHDLKWSSPFDCQPKSCALANFSPRAKQKQKRKRPKHLEPNSSPKHRSRKSPIDPWSRT